MCLNGVRLQTGFYFVVPDRARLSCQFRINYVWDMIRSLYALLWTYFFELNVRNSFYLFWFTYEVELFHQHGRIDLITDLLLIFLTFEYIYTLSIRPNTQTNTHISIILNIYLFYYIFVYLIDVFVVTFDC